MSLFFKFSIAQEEKNSKQFVPDVTNLFIDDFPKSNYCEVFFGCYLETNDVVVTHVNVARCLPKDQKTYIKIKFFPNPRNTASFTTDIVDKKEAAKIDVQKRVRVSLHNIALM